MIVFLSFRAKRHFVSHVLGYKTNFVNTLKHHRVDLKRAWTNSSWHEIYLFEQLLIEVTPEKRLRKTYKILYKFQCNTKPYLQKFVAKGSQLLKEEVLFIFEFTSFFYSLLIDYLALQIYDSQRLSEKNHMYTRKEISGYCLDCILKSR